ncbi:ATP-binding protein [Nitratidesulfovibrio sp. SRB-5]|uniref:ATP-binding protein n=1 Tax=Nitratidesulfovibrio sp. SRB-5 TaxID=2872636 RepID=UPI001025DC38|nr:ATP-binding protein [Nitratidesulfovibrio sp. SRB-5]MBZ2171636.1 ATP-binding protein [Nitratidesulfovibrio sp. SRB-5]RXF78056.1 ATP-binding protein [Desulfovibrio sp. DS-1]
MHNYEFSTTALRETYRPFVRGIAATMAAYLAAPTLVHPLELVTAEACANVVRHAYPQGQPGPVRVRLTVNPRVDMALAVTDWGRGCAACPLPPAVGAPEATSGRGLRIITCLCDAVTGETGPDGNTLHLQLAIPEEQWRTSNLTITETSLLRR